MSEEAIPVDAATGSRNLYLSIACSLAILAATSISYKFIESNRGTELKYHIVYVVIALALVVFLPVDIGEYVFTELTVTFVGCVYPIYRATKAVCTPDEGETKCLTLVCCDCVKIHNAYFPFSFRR
jgi:FtsH-binding integral membrane protein